MLGGFLEVVYQLLYLINYVCVPVPNWSPYGKIMLVKLPLSSLQSVIITFTNTPGSIFSLMSMPSCLQMLPNSAHLTVLRSLMNHDRTYFCTYRFIQLAQWWKPTLYHFGIKSEVNNRLDFKIPNVIVTCLTYAYNIVAKIKVHNAKYFHTMTLYF